ncbi:MAG TPA: Mpo1-like protein [Dokdonella sp.]|uniref:Mpo1 family 2-hydroxy fatty acid dioxygenase n=1 Tax=Dokdonella sp. TaxID=2291710 RepID=UPI002D7E1A5A|nr:Mpo1-like protein [Dokdonella sp.]HET9032564.1 Mpo1-like protein [Dokdonella sp.]
MRSVNQWFGSYSLDHKNPINRAIHSVCVPAILWSVIAALWVIPVPTSIGRSGFWCGMVMVAAFAFYWRMSKPIGIAMLLVFVVFGALTEWLYRSIGPSQLLWAAIAVFVVAWIGQFIGHIIEGARPSFFTDLAYLLIGPAWLAGKLMRRMNINY